MPSPLRSFADGTLFGTTDGTGEPRVLYLHGWGRRHTDFNQVRGLLHAAESPAIEAVAEVTSDHAVAHGSLAIDLPGFGASPPPAEPGGADHYARLVAPVLASCDAPVVVVGHSFGGRVALLLARQQPKDVAALVLTGVPLLKPSAPAKPSLRYRMVRAAAKRGLIAERRLEQLRQRTGSHDYRKASGVMRDVLVAAVNESYEDVLSQLTLPVELLWGDGDTEAPPAQATRAELLLANARLTIVASVGHFVPSEAPGELAAAVRRSLAHVPK